MNHVYMYTIRDENETVYRCTYEDREDVLQRIKEISETPGDGTIIDKLVADGFADENLEHEAVDFLDMATRETNIDGCAVCHWEVIDLED